MSFIEIFGATGHVTVLQECARACVVFTYGLLVVRLGGRRLFANWSALDIVVAIVTGSSLSRALTGNANLFGTLAATTLLVVLHWALAHAAARWAWLSRAVEGLPVPLARDGRVEQRTLVRHAVSEVNLHEALRSAGIESAGAARLIVLEPNGKISVLKRVG